MRGYVIYLGIFLVLFSVIAVGSNQDQETTLTIDYSVDSAQQNYVPGEIIVKYKTQPKVENKKAFTVKDRMYSNRFTKATSKIEHEEPRPVKIKISEEQDIETILQQYNNDPNVEYAEPNYIFDVFYQPNDASFSSQWGPARIRANESWNITQGNSSIIIAIIDTGVDWDHPDLAANIWNNTDEIEANGLDDDSNGYVDDIRGYDFVNFTDNSSCANGEDCTSEDINPTDFDGHGTHCSGIAAAATNNSVGIAGVCWNCKIMAVRAGYKGSDGNGHLTADDIVQALTYAADNNASVISMSFGSTANSSAIQDAIDYAADSGSVLVAATGNSGSTTVNYPAGYSNVIAVAGTSTDDSTYSDSNYGTWVDVAAPGNSIYSTYPDDTYATGTGTSMACPHVAGAAGILLSYNSSLTHFQIRDTLNQTGFDISFSGIDLPRIDLFQALISVDAISPSITFLNLTPDNESAISQAVFNINVTSNEELNSALLDFNGTNFTMYGEGTNFYLNKTATLSGNITLKVYGIDLNNNTGISDQLTYNLNNSPPNITYFFPLTNASVNENSSLFFNQSATDPDSDTINYQWLIDGTLNSTEINFTYQPNFSDAGYHNITLIVSDLAKESSRWWNITVNNTNRVVTIINITTPANNSRIELNNATPFKVSVNDPDGPDLNYTWDFGDNTNATTENTTKTYLTPGLYNVSINVSDGQYSDKLTMNISVKDTTQPTISATHNTTIRSGNNLTISVNVTDYSNVSNVNLTYNITPMNLTNQSGTIYNWTIVAPTDGGNNFLCKRHSR